MKLYIKQKVFSLNERFTVKDEYGYDKYFVEGQFLSIPKKFIICDSNGCPAAEITKKLLSLPQRYFVDAGGVWIAEITKEITLFTHRFTVSGPNWTVKGDFFAHEYTIYRGNTIAATVSKEWFSWGDSYVINVPDTRDELIALAVVIVIDESISDSNNANNF